MAGTSMKPVAIFRHLPIEGPGYFATFLDNNHIPWQLIKIDAGENAPRDIQEFSGLVFMGGPMSVNDDLPWIDSSLALIRQAVDIDMPVLGHCLGGQLMAKALGGVVSVNPFKEMGWGEVSIPENPVASSWLSDAFSNFSLAWRNFQLTTWYNQHFIQFLLRKPGFCNGYASRNAMSC